jgi:polyhydroxyalkanoate synthesis regulator phasin
MGEITSEQAQEYLKRFELLEEAQIAERRRASMQLRFRQLSALMSSRHAFGVEAGRERELDLVRERWARLRQALSG